MKDYVCACCESRHDYDAYPEWKPVRIDKKRVVCPECASNSLLLSKQEAKNLRALLGNVVPLLKSFLAPKSRLLKARITRQQIETAKLILKRLGRLTG